MFVALVVELVLCAIFRDELIVAAVDAVDGWPVALIAGLSWLPWGLLFLLPGLATWRAPGRRRRRVAVPALVALAVPAVAQLPVLLSRHRYASDMFLAASSTVEGAALIGGALWALVGPLCVSLLFLTVRWAVNRTKGQKTRFAGPMSQRAGAVVLAAGSLAGLVAAVLT